MDSSTDQNMKRKNVGFGILAGIGFAVGGFIVGTIITGLMIALFFGSWSCLDCIYIIVFYSPIVGLLIAVTVGVIGGRRTYKRLSEKH